jgi:hypothetical protein
MFGAGSVCYYLMFSGVFGTVNLRCVDLLPPDLWRVVVAVQDDSRPTDNGPFSSRMRLPKCAK